MLLDAPSSVPQETRFELLPIAGRIAPQLTEEDAQPIGEEIERVALTRNGGASAEALYEAAKYAASPLHPKLNWDDEECGHLYRLDQVRGIAQSISIKVVTSDEEPAQSARAFVAVRSEENGRHHEYVPIRIVRESRDMSEKVIEEAEREFKSRARKYEQYRELFAERHVGLHKVLEAIDEMSEEGEEGD